MSDSYTKPDILIDLGDLGLPEIPLIGHHRLKTASTGLGEHVHEGIIEICFLARGMRTYHVGGKDFSFKGGELFVTFPGEGHGSGGHVHGRGALYWLHVRSSGLKSFLGMNMANSRPLLESLLSMPNRCFKGSQEFRILMERLFFLHRERIKDPLSKIEAIGVLLELLTLVIKWSNLSVKNMMTDPIRQTVQYISRDLEKKISLDDLAERTNLSLSRFKTRFRQEVGVPPGEFILREKIERAKDLLISSDISITEVSHRLGFSSSQYFSTVYRRFTNSPPSELRLKKRGVP